MLLHQLPNRNRQNWGQANSGAPAQAQGLPLSSRAQNSRSRLCRSRFGKCRADVPIDQSVWMPDYARTGRAWTESNFRHSSAADREHEKGGATAAMAPPVENSLKQGVIKEPGN